MIAYLEKTIGELVAEAPLRANVFEKRRIDYCCNGRRAIEEVCAEKSIPVQELLDELEGRESPDDAGGRQTRSMADLASHIVSRHHEYLRSTLPSITLKMELVVAVHGAAHPFLEEVGRVFQGLADELTAHMAKEEMVLFPHIVAMEAALRNHAPAPAAPGGTVRNPIRMMEHEHDDAGRALTTIRELTSNHEPPEGACNTFRALYAQFAELESDLHTHIHLENNILFPRAAAMEDGTRN